MLGEKKKSRSRTSGTLQNTSQPFTDQNHPMPCKPPPSQFSLTQDNVFTRYEYLVAINEGPVRDPAKAAASLRSRGCQRQGGSEGLAVHDARAGFLAEFQLHAGSKPTLGTTQAVVEGGPVNVLGTLRKNDGRALKPQRLLAGLKDQLGLVVPPGAIGSSNDRLAVGGDGGDGAVEDVIPVMLLGVVLYLGIAPAENSKVSGTQPREQSGEDRQDSSLTL